MRLKIWLKILLRIKEWVLSLIYPERCILCDAVVGGDAVCENCKDKLRLTENERVCKKCSRPVGEDAVLCPDCLVRPRYFTASFAAAVYNDELRSSVIRFKFNKRPDYHRGYARIMLAHLRSLDSLPVIDAVIGVPLSKERYRERGYHQATLIAKEVAKGLGLPVFKNVLKKIRHTPAQSSLPREARLENLRGAFCVFKKEKIKDKTILLIDDVFTTGSTADEISKTLLRAGAKEVYVAAFSVTP